MKKLALVLLLLAAPTALAGDYHGNRNSFVFHDSGCMHYNCKNCTRIFKERAEAIDAGYRPCKICRP